MEQHHPEQQNKPMKMSALFDATGAYRYWLRRQWCDAAPNVTFMMLNPSTADAQTNDATIRRCIRFAQTWGYGSLTVVNLFARVATQPQALRCVADPVGEECDRHLLAAVRACDRLILAWGNSGQLYGRSAAVLELLTPEIEGYCLGVTQSGQPRHPLYLSQAVQPVRYPLS